MFDLIDMIVVRPIVNILFVIYNYVGDFGLAIIIFTILVKCAMWPLMKRQLHQTRMMKKIQPELAEIKKHCNGNRQLESIQMMDLYKRNNIKPFRSIVTVFIQLPIFIALFTAINVSVRPCIVSDDLKVTVSRCANSSTNIEYNVNHSAYPFVRSMNRISELINTQNEYFDAYTKNPDEANYPFEPKLFGAIDLSVSPNQIFTNFGLSTVVITLFAIASAVVQYIMARQNDPSRQTGKKRRTMRELMREAADGKETNQDEINAVAQSQMTLMTPVMMLFLMFNMPGAIVLYYLLNNIITTALQKLILSRNLTEMETAADKKILKDLKSLEAKEAEIVEQPAKTKIKAKQSHYSNSSKNKNKKENVHITRISASDNKKKRR